MDWKFIGNYEKDTTGRNTDEHRLDGFSRIQNPCASVSSVKSVFYFTLLYFFARRSNNIFANFARFAVKFTTIGLMTLTLTQGAKKHAAKNPQKGWKNSRF